MQRIEEQAHAKINLALHVTGQREDGYHLLDTLVTFTEAGDRLWFEPATKDGFSLSGPFAGDLPVPSDTGGNLVLGARDALRHHLTSQNTATPSVHIHLEKNLPVSSGIGGGSADAAATLRGLMRLWSASIPIEIMEAIALKLGADVPMCLHSRPLLARGIGEDMTPARIPSMPILLVNPRVPVSTPRIFQSLKHKNYPPMPEGLDDLNAETLSRLMPLRNDLQPPAQTLEPLISMVCGDLDKAGAGLARMSGSGATCFGLFDTETACNDAASALEESHPDWFISSTRTLS